MNKWDLLEIISFVALMNILNWCVKNSFQFDAFVVGILIYILGSAKSLIK